MKLNLKYLFLPIAAFGLMCSIAIGQDDWEDDSWDDTSTDDEWSDDSDSWDDGSTDDSWDDGNTDDSWDDGSGDSWDEGSSDDSWDDGTGSGTDDVWGEGSGTGTTSGGGQGAGAGDGYGDIELQEGADGELPEPQEPLLPWNRRSLEERTPIAYDQIREADVFWSKTIWRVIDTREKLNLPFKWPKRPLINILMDAVESGAVTAYDGLDDEFRQPLEANSMSSFGGGSDTVWVYDPILEIEVPTVTSNEFDPMKVNKFRLKEVWFFDEETSTMVVRIMGIAPILDSYDEYGNFRGELPMFWAYFPGLREILVKEEAFNPFPNSVRLTWDDLFSYRLFGSYIFKEDNVKDYRIKDYTSGINSLYESERVKTDLFNFEHDLWSY